MQAAQRGAGEAQRDPGDDRRRADRHQPTDRRHPPADQPVGTDRQGSDAGGGGRLGTAHPGAAAAQDQCPPGAGLPPARLRIGKFAGRSAGESGTGRTGDSGTAIAGPADGRVPALARQPSAGAGAQRGQVAAHHSVVRGVTGRAGGAAATDAGALLLPLPGAAQAAPPGRAQL